MSILERSPTFAEKTMEEKKWIKTEQMLEDLMNDPNNEQEYTHFKVESYVPLIG